MPHQPILPAFRLRKRGCQWHTNSAQAAQLVNELKLRSYQWSCKSMFTRHGKLNPIEILRSKIISGVSSYDIRSPIYKELYKKGDINAWHKCRTRKFNAPFNNGNLDSNILTAEVHFYRNQLTGEAYYGRDYKVKFDNSGNQQIPVNKFLKSISKEGQNYDHKMYNVR